MNTNSVAQEMMGGLKLKIASGTSASKSPEEILRALDKYGIEWYVSEEADLLIKSWTVVAEKFVGPEEATVIRAKRPSPECKDDLDWLCKNLEGVKREFLNRWIAVCKNRVVGSAVNVLELMEQVKQFEKPLITFIPGEPPIWKFTYAI
jgi:hypothetical protein